MSLSYADQQSVVIDDNGITVSSVLDPNKILRAINGGIFFSSDSGTSWVTGVTPDGINTSLLTAGQIDVSKITIFSNGSPAFKWDVLGLNAYKQAEDGSYSVDTFVRHDQYGLYGIKGFGSNFVPVGNNDNEKIAYIENNASFALTWNGFSLKSDTNLGFLRITSENDFEVFRTVDNSDRLAIKIGKLRLVGGVPIYGLELYDNTGAVVLSQSDNGYLGLSGMIYVGPSFDSSKVKMGKVQSYSGGVWAVFQAKNSNGDTTFEIRDDGTAILKGTIEATSGKIGGFNISGFSLSSPFITITEDTIKLEKDGTITALFSKNGNKLTGNLDITGNSTVSGKLIVGKITIDAATNSGEGSIFSDNGTSTNFQIFGSGRIVTDSIKLSGSIEIDKYIKLNKAFIFNPSFDISSAAAEGIAKSLNLFIAAGDYLNSSYALEIHDTGLMKAKNIEINGGILGSLFVSGVLTVGTDGIEIYGGATGLIKSKAFDSMNGWSISKDGSAIFNNITARGSIKTAVFEYGTIQAIGGTLLVRPSAIIKSFSSSDNQTFVLTVDSSVGFTVGDRCCVQVGSIL